MFFLFKNKGSRKIEHQNSCVQGIVAVMDASLLAVVSLPFLFLLLAFCAPSSVPWLFLVRVEGFGGAYHQKCVEIKRLIEAYPMTVDWFHQRFLARCRI
jgi:hypothetical protein